jgi:iron complex outermembrane recepter protein
MFKRTQVCAGVFAAFGTGLMLSSGAALAQEAQRIEITGSAIKRIDAEGSLPIQIITREDIARSGVVNTEQLLQSLSSISSQGGVSTTTGAGSSTYGRATVSVRGLGDSRTLVLVNGRRVAAFAGGGGAAVNVNTIPIAAIERVELLKDGASSIYGSDAVAGVVNFILTKGFSGVEVGVSTGKPTRDGGGNNNKATVVAGFGDLAKDRFNVTVSGSVEREKELMAKDRAFAKSGNNFPFTVAGATGQGNIEGAIDPNTGVRVTGFGNSPGSGYGNPFAALGRCGDLNMFQNPTPTSKGLPFCAFDSSAFVALIPDRDATSFTLNGAFRINDAVELFGDVLAAKSVVTQRIQPSPVRRSFLQTDALFAQQGVTSALLLRPTNPNYQTAADYLTANGQAALVGQTLAVTARVFDFGPRTAKDTADQSRLVFGARGTLFGQDYEAAYSANKSKTAGSVIDGYFSQVGYAKATNALDSDWNPWSLTQSATFNSRIAGAKYVGPTLDAVSKSNVLDGKVSGELFALPGGAAQYAAGVQYRKETYVTTPSEALGLGDIAGLGGSVPPVDRDRKVGAGYGELVMPVLKDLEITLAGRTDKYSGDVGTSTTYKISGRYQPVKQVVVRAALGSGFRAPTLTDLWTPQTLGTSETFTDPITGATNLQVNALSGGNPLLKPEKSNQFTMGLIVQPLEDLSIGVDFFNVKITDAINSPSAQEVVSGFRSGNPTYAGSVTLGPGGDIDSIEIVTVNSGDVKVQGIDLDARYRLKFGGDRLDLSLAGTYFIKYAETSPGGATSQKVGTIVDANGDPVIGSNSGGVILRWKHALAATYTTGGWAMTLQQNYTSGYETGFRQIDGERNFMSSQFLYDANVTYTGIKNLRLGVGVKNLFDKDPPGVFVPVSNQFQSGYDVTQYDARSRYVYLSAAYKFF